jgi:alpha-tubulin suppressor-like RCC1 family protein
MRFLIVVAAAMLTWPKGPLEGQWVRCGSRSTPPCTASAVTFRTISAGFQHSCGVSRRGDAYCWGDGRKGALGNGTDAIQRMPQRVAGTHAWEEIGAGGDYSCGLTTAGEVYCWGDAQPVPGWPERQWVPAKVSLLVPARSLAVGRRHACVLDGDGRARCWGWNVDGESGSGTSGLQASMIAVPAPVESDARFAMLSAGLDFTCGVTTGGGVECWGTNIDGVIGANARDRCGDVGPIACATRPVTVSMPEPILQVSSGGRHACVLGASGTVYCWGANGTGQAGRYGPETRHVAAPTAVRVPHVRRFIALSSGGIQTCALAESNRGFCWGGDQLSVGEDLHPDDVAPRPAADGSRLAAIAAGVTFACALDSGHRLLCWGDTILGALGVR